MAYVQAELSLMRQKHYETGPSLMDGNICYTNSFRMEQKPDYYREIVEDTISTFIRVWSKCVWVYFRACVSYRNGTHASH